MMRNAFAGAACCLLLLTLEGCGGSAPVAVNQTANRAANQATAPADRSATSPNAVNTQNAPVAAASPKSPAPAGGGEPVDTSRYDAEIKRLEEKARKNSADQPTRLALAKAYTERGDALTGVRQYRAALGDYRRALRNDPDNKQAQQMSGTIISILKTMGRDIPPEGQEPAPLPLKQ
jgi:cytochrome c-type biogenesis protein CcmH/NrfG